MATKKTPKAAPAAEKKKPAHSVAEFLSLQIALSDKSQTQIASECGYANPNMIAMVKTGRTPVPLNKVGALAKSLGLDAFHLYRMVMMEYHPETWETLEPFLESKDRVTQNERDVLEVIRAATGTGLQLDLTNENVRKILVDAAHAAVAVQKDFNAGTLERYEKAPNRYKERARA